MISLGGRIRPQNDRREEEKRLWVWLRGRTNTKIREMFEEISNRRIGLGVVKSRRVYTLL